MKIRVLCVDDHPLVRKGIASILAVESDMELVGEAGTGREAIEQFRKLRPDVTLMDLRMQDLNGIEATREIRKEFPDARILALTSYDGDQDIYKAIEAGVRGYLLKEMVHTEVVRAIRTVHSGKRLMPPEVVQRLNEHLPQAALTKREVEVLGLVARGLGNKEIAERLGTASGTVKIHVQNILSKLEASDRTHAVTIALERGILHLYDALSMMARAAMLCSVESHRLPFPGCRNVASTRRRSRPAASARRLRNYMRRFIITGAPGAGKTSIIRQLELDGFSVVEEAATDVIAAAQAQGTAEPWTHPSFIDAIASLQRDRQIRASYQPDEVQFHDRCAVCTAALAVYLGALFHPSWQANGPHLKRSNLPRPSFLHSQSWLCHADRRTPNDP